jgi:hypothetical protein
VTIATAGHRTRPTRGLHGCHDARDAGHGQASRLPLMCVHTHRFIVRELVSRTLGPRGDAEEHQGPRQSGTSRLLQAMDAYRYANCLKNPGMRFAPATQPRRCTGISPDQEPPRVFLTRVAFPPVVVSALASVAEVRRLRLLSADRVVPPGPESLEHWEGSYEFRKESRMKTTTEFFNGLDEAMHNKEQLARLGFGTRGYPVYHRSWNPDPRYLSRKIALPGLTVSLDNSLGIRPASFRESSVLIYLWRRVTPRSLTAIGRWVIPAEDEHLQLFLKGLEVLLDSDLGEEGFKVLMEALVFDADLTVAA